MELFKKIVIWLIIWFIASLLITLSLSFLNNFLFLYNFLWTRVFLAIFLLGNIIAIPILVIVQHWKREYKRLLSLGLTREIAFKLASENTKYYLPKWILKSLI